MRNILYRRLNIPKSTKNENKNYQTDIKNEITENILHDKLTSLTSEKNNTINHEIINIKRPQTCKTNRNRINYKKIEFKT